MIAVGADQFSGGVAPAVPMAPGDSVTVYPVAARQRGFVTVRGNVWVEGEVGFTPGMKLSDAIRLAGGPKPDVYLDRILVTRTREDSTFMQLRSAFADSTGTLRDDLALEDEDEVRVFSRTTFRPETYVAIVGAVRRPGRVAFRDGMTVRDAILLADGLAQDAQLETEIARLPADRPAGSAGGDGPRPAGLELRGRTRGGRRRRPRGCPAVPVRQRARAPAGRMVSAAHRGAERSGEITGTLFAALQDRAAGGSDRSGRRSHR